MQDSYLLLDSYESMGTIWHVEVEESTQTDKRDFVKQQVVDFLEMFNAKYSRFKPDSIVSSFNREREVAHDKDLETMLLYGEKISLATEGAFSLYRGRAIAEKGYGAASGSDFAEVKSSVTTSGSNMFLSGNQLIDLGGIGKGYAIDCIAAILKNSGFDAFVVNGGGDMYVACRAGDSIAVHLQHPLRSDEVIGSVNLSNQSLCASSSYVRMWKKDGEYKNHFVTDDNKEIWAASFVVGESACVADVLATVCCLFVDQEEQLRKIAHTTGVRYLVINEDFSVRGDLQLAKAE